LERLLQKGVVEQVDLADGQVVQGPKVGVHLAQFFGGERACHRLAAVRSFPFRLGGYGCHRSSPWVLGSSLVAFPWSARPRSGEPRYFGPRPDSVVPLALRWAAVFAGCLFCCCRKSSAGPPLCRFSSSTNPQAQRDGGQGDGGQKRASGGGMLGVARTRE